MTVAIKNALTCKFCIVLAVASFIGTPCTAEVEDPVQTRQSGDGQPGAQKKVKRRFEKEQLTPPSRKKLKADDRK